MPIYPGDSNRRIGRTNENVNAVRVVYICSSIITLIFGFFMTFRGSDWRNWNNLQKGCFFIVVSPGNSEKWSFLDLKSNNCVEFSVFNVFS